MSKRKKDLLKFLLTVLVLYVALKYLLLPIVNSPEFMSFTQKLGVFGYLVVIGYVVLSHVFAPIAGTPGVVLGVTIYGIKQVCGYCMLVVLLAHQLVFIFQNDLVELG